MAYTFEQIFAADPSTPENVATNGLVTIFAPGDAAQTPLTITTVDGLALANPIKVNDAGYGPAFMHATLDRVAWAGGGFTGFFTSYDGMKEEAVAARRAAEAAALEARAPTDQAVDAGILRADIPRTVANAVAEAPAVIDAAAVAVGAAVKTADLVKGTDPRIPFIGPTSDYSRVIVDDYARIALGIKDDGTVYTPHLEADRFAIEELDADTITAGKQINAAGQLTSAGPNSNFGGDYAKVWTDSQHRIAIGIRDTGTVYIPSLEAPALGLPEDPPHLPARRTAAGIVVRRESRSDLIMTDGDSITQGIGDQSGLGGYPGRLSRLLGAKATVYNQGLAGRTSTELLIRQGGIVPLVTVAGNTIPASGSVPVSRMTPTTSYRFANSAATVWEWEGTLAGVPGKLLHDLQSATPDAGWTFARTTAGTPVPVPQEAPFVMTLADAYREATLITWYGRNNSNTPNSYQDAVRDTRAAIAHLTPEQPRYLVLSILTSGGEKKPGTGYLAVMAANNALAERYGDRYLDVRRYLIDRGLADAGVTPTSQDLLDIAGDTVPTSLRADDTHPNALGYDLIAAFVHSALLAKGWIA